MEASLLETSHQCTHSHNYVLWIRLTLKGCFRKEHISNYNSSDSLQVSDSSDLIVLYSITTDVITLLYFDINWKKKKKYNL